MTGFTELLGLDPDKLLALEERLGRTRLYDYYPETGPLRRELYSKHMEFYRATAEHDEVAFIAGNRTGKSFAACYAATCHLIGWYPVWWEGRRFDRPIVCWAAGEDAKAVRESLQVHFMGPPEAPGTGLVPGDLIIRSPSRGGIPDAVDFAQVRRVDGLGMSRLLLKAFEQGRESFQGAHIDVGICDEEPPLAVYTEFKTRTLSTVPGQRGGLLMSTFTPLKGISDVVLQFLPGGRMPETEELRRAAWGW